MSTMNIKVKIKNEVEEEDKDKNLISFIKAWKWAEELTDRKIGSAFFLVERENVGNQKVCDKEIVEFSEDSDATILNHRIT